MNKKQNILDLSLLPDHAQIQILDFYDFLFQKYGSASKLLSDNETKEAKVEGETYKRFSEFFSTSVKVKDFTNYSRDELHKR